jgi:hypothetical protein
MPKTKQSPHCSVPGCRAKRPHIDGPVGQALNSTFSDPAKLAARVKTALGELINSMKQDLDADRTVAYMSRLRQTEELYHRALYVLLIASPEEVQHVLSGDTPNSYMAIYRRVNKEILDNRGSALNAPQPGTAAGDQITAVRTLNDAAHGSFRFLLTCIGIARNPQVKQTFFKYFDHVNRYWTYLNYIEGMFSAGKSRADVLLGVRNIHKPAAAWKNPEGGDSPKP